MGSVPMRPPAFVPENFTTDIKSGRILGHRSTLTDIYARNYLETVFQWDFQGNRYGRPSGKGEIQMKKAEDCTAPFCGPGANRAFKP